MNEQKTHTSESPVIYPGGQMATRRRFIPNVPVVNHLGQELAFYDDLVKDRIVILHLMSLHHESHYPVARNLMRLQEHLGRRLGNDIFIHSITTEPLEDTTKRLRIFARQHRARDGWQFLTGSLTAIQSIRNCLFVHSGVGTSGAPLNKQSASSDHDAQDCSLGLLRYGNDRSGLWGSVPGKANPAMIVERISWLTPGRKTADGRLVRRGPYPKQQFAGVRSGAR